MRIDFDFLCFSYSCDFIHKLLANLKQPLKEQVELIPKVKLIRSPTRIGLIKARMMGAVNSQGPALILMDSHIEVTPGEKGKFIFMGHQIELLGWLEPLLDRLVVNKNITSISVAENIDIDTLELKYSHNSTFVFVNGFEWDMIFNWKEPFEPEGKKRKHLNDPVASPTMLGAFFGDF